MIDRSKPAPPPTATPAAKVAGPGPGRPKDLGKRVAILEAAKQLFTSLGFEGASMDQIAAGAGVSKLTVYSHFGDKEALFAAAVREHCQQQVPSSLFAAEADLPLRDRLMVIARAFYSMISSPEAVAGHRIMCAPQLTHTHLPQLFWEAGPQRVQSEFAALLERRIVAGELRIADLPRAASQFFTLLKGEPHARMVFGCCAQIDAGDVESHLAASVDMFLRAYAVPQD